MFLYLQGDEYNAETCGHKTVVCDDEKIQAKN